MTDNYFKPTKPIIYLPLLAVYGGCLVGAYLLNESGRATASYLVFGSGLIAAIAFGFHVLRPR